MDLGSYPDGRVYVSNLLRRFFSLESVMTAERMKKLPGKLIAMWVVE